VLPLSSLAATPVRQPCEFLLPPGEVAKIHCSPDYAYGSGGFPAWGIMPNSELVFEIEVLSYS
jgi:peptidylprolyl isomerase